MFTYIDVQITADRLPYFCLDDIILLVVVLQRTIPSPGVNGGIVRNNCITRTHWGYDPFRWRHYGRDSVSNHQPRDCLFNRLFRRRSKKTSRLRVTGLCVGNSPGTGEFPAQMASNAENVFIWRHHAVCNKLSHYARRRLGLKLKRGIVIGPRESHKRKWQVNHQELKLCFRLADQKPC